MPRTNQDRANHGTAENLTRRLEHQIRQAERKLTLQERWDRAISAWRATRNIRS